MSGQISESKINEIRERTDIVELISQYVSLKQSGANHAGLCPFHSEKSPSFSVNAARQFFHCFGCGVGGDVFSFLMKTEGLVFPDAARLLAERVGIELEEYTPTPEEELRERQRERLYRVNEVAAAYFHQLLMDHPSGDPARKYMKVRGYGRKAAGEYQIGFALDSWDGLKKHLEAQGLAADDARTLGLTRPGKQGRGDYDLFRGRLMFPVYDLSGRIVAFAGRVLDDSKPKYINSPESPVYHKGQVLFGLYQARQAMRQSGEVLLVEGYFDQLALYRSGFPQVVATCGTALTPDHARLLKRYVQRVVLLFDQDAAGKKATFKAMTVLQEEGIPAAVIELPQGEDPDSFIQNEGVEAFRGRLDNARSVMDFFMDDVLAAAGGGVEQKVRAAEQIVAQIAGLSSELEQDLYLKQLAQRSGIGLEQLKQVGKKVSGAEKQKSRRIDTVPLPQEDYSSSQSQSQSQPQPQGTGTKTNNVPWSLDENRLLCLIFHRGDARQRITAETVSSFFHSDVAQHVAEKMLQQFETSENLNMQSIGEGFTAEILNSFMLVVSSPAEESEGDIDRILEDFKRKRGRKPRLEIEQAKNRQLFG